MYDHSILIYVLYSRSSKDLQKTLSQVLGLSLKGLGHAILGNFSIDQVVIELTEITK